MALVDDVGAYLTTQTLAGDATAWPLALSWMPPTPAQVVGVLATGGYASAAKAGLDYPTFQLLVRVASHAESTAGATQAESLYLALDHCGPVTIGSTAYRDIQAEHPPAYLGEDASGRPEWSLNFRCWRSR